MNVEKRVPQRKNGRKLGFQADIAPWIRLIIFSLKKAPPCLSEFAPYLDFATRLAFLQVLNDMAFRFQHTYADSYQQQMLRTHTCKKLGLIKSTKLKA